MYNYSENYFIALDSKNILHKIEFDKYQQKLFFEDNINLNDNYPEFNSGLNNIIIWNILLFLTNRVPLSYTDARRG